MEALAIAPLRSAPDVELTLPGSKSLTNRYLLLAALAKGRSALSEVLVAEDTEAMISCVRALGATVEHVPGGVEVTGVSGTVPASGAAFARASGTTARFVAPVLALAAGPWELDGDPQLRARPMADLYDSLRALGAEVSALEPPASLPVSIRGPVTDDVATVSGAVSSQFLSGLLLAGPLLRSGLEVRVMGELVSRPYVEMTVDSMRRFGALVEPIPGGFKVGPGGYRATDVAVEPDASAASYFYAAAAATGGRVAIRGLGMSSVQGDIAFVDVLEQMGCAVRRERDLLEVSGRVRLRGVDADLTDFSDMVPTLAALAALAETPTTISGVGFIRAKESDRIGAVVTELQRLGADAVELPGGLRIEPSSLHGGLVHTYGDHRIAMAFSVLGLVVPGIEIEDPSCVSKTFPEFFVTLERLRV